MSELVPDVIRDIGQQMPQLEGESDIAYVNFLHWIHQGCPSLDALASGLRTSYEQLSNWKSAYDWYGRAEASPQGIRARIRAHELARELDLKIDEKLSSRIMALIERTVRKIMIADAFSDVPVVPAKELASLLKSVHDYERLESGQSTENHAHVHRQIELDEDAIDELEPDELRALQKALKKLGDGS